MNTQKEPVREAADKIQQGGLVKAIRDVIPKSALDTANEVIDDVSEVADKGLKSAAKAIQKHPMQAALIGLGVGALVGTLLFRGSRNA